MLIKILARDNSCVMNEIYGSFYCRARYKRFCGMYAFFNNISIIYEGQNLRASMSCYEVETMLDTTILEHCT